MLIESLCCKESCLALTGSWWEHHSQPWVNRRGLSSRTAALQPGFRGTSPTPFLWREDKSWDPPLHRSALGRSFHSPLRSELTLRELLLATTHFSFPEVVYENFKSSELMINYVNKIKLIYKYDLEVDGWMMIPHTPDLVWMICIICITSLLKELYLENWYDFKHIIISAIRWPTQHSTTCNRFAIVSCTSLWGEKFSTRRTKVCFYSSCRSPSQRRIMRSMQVV